MPRESRERERGQSEGREPGRGFVRSVEDAGKDIRSHVCAGWLLPQPHHGHLTLSSRSTCRGRVRVQEVYGGAGGGAGCPCKMKETGRKTKYPLQL